MGYKFRWPAIVKLNLKLKDLLESRVDEKYYLSDKKIESISKWNAQQKPFDNMIKAEKNGYFGTLTTRDGDEQSGMKLVKEFIKEKQPFGTFSQENVVSSKEDETISTLTSTGAFSRHKIIENVFESQHHAGKIYNILDLAPTFKENHGNGFFIKEATKKGYKEAKDGDGIYIDRPHQKRGVVQKGMIQTLKTFPDVGVVIKDHGNYISLKDKKGRFNTQDKRAWKDKKIIGTIATNDSFTPKILETNSFKIRKITPREAFRLMGLDEKRIDLIQNSKLIPHNKQYFLAGNSIVVQVLEAIFSKIDFPKNRPLKVFETFAGYGSQAIALENLGFVLETHISEWFVDAIIAYAILHHNEFFYQTIKDLKYWEKEKCIEWLNGIGHDEHDGLTLSTDSKSPNNLKRLNLDKLKALVAANVVSKNKGSILEVNADMLDQYDLLTYSFPCQDLSIAGKSKGMKKGDGTRSGLLWEIERILKELSKVNKLPKVLLMENVPQIHSKKHIEDFEKWQLFLMDLGYKNSWKDLNAKNFGIPQNRNRTFLISFLDQEIEDNKSVQLKLF